MPNLAGVIVSTPRALTTATCQVGRRTRLHRAIVRGLSAAQAKALLTTVRSRDAVAKARQRVTAELIADHERVYRRSKQTDKELKELVAATGTTPLDLHGIGLSGSS